MQRVIVTVKRDDETRARDLEVPADMQAIQLAGLVAEALRWQGDASGGKQSYTIEAFPLGRNIEPRETLSAAGVWDGSWLVFHPTFAATPQVSANIAPQVAATPYATPEKRSNPISTSTPPGGPNQAPLPQAIPQPQAAPIVQQPPATTVTGWRSLGLDLPAPGPEPASTPTFTPQAPPQPQSQPPPLYEAQEPEQPPVLNKQSSSFVWKQIDD